MKTLDDLMEMMRILRGPSGCPWDREQSLISLGPMLVEEAYEVIEAAEAGNYPELRDEIGDLMFQLVFYGQFGEELGVFNLKESIDRVYQKMYRRHPHVFGDGQASTTAEVLSNWETIKAEERASQPADNLSPASILDGVSKKLPGLIEANQLTGRAARVGFDWNGPEDVFAKLDEELAELREEIKKSDDRAIAEEMGDLLFVVVNLARKLGVEPETALKAANRKFRRRFNHIEAALQAEGRSVNDSTLEEMDGLWDEAKRLEREKGKP